MDPSLEGILFQAATPFMPLLSCLKTEVITALVSLGAWDAGERGHMHKTLSRGNGQLVALIHSSTREKSLVPVPANLHLHDALASTH